MNTKYQSGFTLLEVLLSSFILFSTIVTMTLIYRGAVLSSDKSEQALSVSVAAHAVQRIVSDEFREMIDKSQPYGDGLYGEVAYRWSAVATHKGIRRGSPDGSSSSRELTLWQINLTVSKGMMTKQFNYSEISW